MNKAEPPDPEDPCEGCAFNRIGCQCQRFMAAGCIPTYGITLEKLLGIEEKHEKQE
jgi:hypothetical protein